MAALGLKPSLAKGSPYKLGTAVVGANTIDFTIIPNEAGREFSAVFQAIGTLTSLASALQISLDGINFVDYLAAANFLAAAAALIVVPASGTKPMVAGAIYRINVTAATGPVDIWVTIN